MHWHPIHKQVPSSAGVDQVDSSDAAVELEVMPPANMSASGSHMFDVNATIEKATKLVSELKKEMA